MRGIGFAATVAALCVPQAAWAETATMTGVYAAPYREAAMLGSLAVERISGQDGQALVFAIERALSAGTPHFEIVGGRTGRDIADGGLQGVVTTNVNETPFVRKDKKCVQYDANDKKKCVKEEQVEVRCRRRTVEVSADLRLVRNSDGRIVYSATRPYREEVSWCQGETQNRSVDNVVAAAVAAIADQVRGDITPNYTTYRIRFRESTKGLAKDQATQFKALIKLTQRDLRAACSGFETLARAAAQASVAFNLGLCAEARGDYDGALGYYNAALPLIGGRGGEAAEGIGRVERLAAGRADAEERNRLLRRRG